MADGITTRVHGLPDLRAALQELSADLRRRVIKGALRDAARPILRAAKAQAPVLQQHAPHRIRGAVRDNIRVFASKLRKAASGEIGTYITVAVPPAKRRTLKRVAKLRRQGVRVDVRGDPFYFRFLEMGTVKMRARPFLGPAFAAHKDAALALFQRRVAERIAKANTRSRAAA